MATTPLPTSLPVWEFHPSATSAPAGGALAVPQLFVSLASVPDHRDPRGVRHPLPAVLALICCALLCGARHLTAISDWGRNHSPELMAALGFTRKTPCPATLHYVLAGLAWDKLEVALREWITAVQTQLAEAAEWEEALALDGKTMRGALKLEAEITATVSALGHRLGLTAGMKEVKDGDEVAAVESLLKELVLVGQVVTTDALHTQVETARQIRVQGGDYVMLVKGNQPELQEQVTALFRTGSAALSEPAEHWDRATVTETGQGHGRIETRWLMAVSLPAGEWEWPGVAQAFVVVRDVWKPKRKKRHHEVVYGITSLARAQAGPDDLLRLLRGHWKIENRSHWVRDVTFGEDACLVHTGKIPQVLALLRCAVISRLRAGSISNMARETRRLAAKPWACLPLIGLACDY